MLRPRRAHAARTRVLLILLPQVQVQVQVQVQAQVQVLKYLYFDVLQYQLDRKYNKRKLRNANKPYFTDVQSAIHVVRCSFSDSSSSKRTRTQTARHKWVLFVGGGGHWGHRWSQVVASGRRRVGQVGDDFW